MSNINDKLDKIGEDLGVIKVTMAVQTEQLKDHMHRSDLLEKRVEQVAASVIPIQSHVDMVKGAIKFGSILVTILSVMIMIVRFYHHG